MEDMLSHFEALLGPMTWRLSTLVESETPTSDKPSVDRLGSWLVKWGTQQGAQVIRHSQPIVGDFIECRFNAEIPGKPILIFCHMDTVHPLGSVEKRPTRIEEDVLYGVGAYDMKAGIAVVQTVIEELRAAEQMPNRPITLLFTSDEEIGSPYSRRLIEARAKEACLALVMEFSGYTEGIVTGRKGVGIFQITALGKEAHTGTAPETGINAIVELAQHINEIKALSAPEKGTLVTPSVIRGGTSHNVIPGECDLVINVRVQYHSEAERIYRELEALSDAPTILPGAELILTGDFMRPPMEQDARMGQTFETLKEITGLYLTDEFRGGGSDGCFSAALGVPTLDGLGPSGEGAHAAHEQVFLPSMPRRAALLATILSRWPMDAS
jgi:glutamate carboxypeptidase